VGGALPLTRSVFERIWGTPDLLVSMDAVIAWCPWWHRAAGAAARRPQTEGLHSARPLLRAGRGPAVYGATPAMGGLEVVPGSQGAEGAVCASGVWRPPATGVRCRKVLLSPGGAEHAAASDGQGRRPRAVGLARRARRQGGLWRRRRAAARKLPQPKPKPERGQRRGRARPAVAVGGRVHDSAPGALSAWASRGQVLTHWPREAPGSGANCEPLSAQAAGGSHTPVALTDEQRRGES
jgi:hypothetical protein